MKRSISLLLTLAFASNLFGAARSNGFILSDLNNLHGFNMQLILAAKIGVNVAAIKKILSQGANINITDSQGNTALHYAALNANHEVIKFLVDSRANINIKNKDNKLPIDLVPLDPNGRNNYLNKYFLEQFLNFHTTPGQNMYYLKAAVMHSFISDTKILKLFLKSKTFDSQFKIAERFIHDAFKPTLKVLLEHNSLFGNETLSRIKKLFVSNGKNNDILSAAISDKTDMVTTLLKLNRADLAQLNAKDATGTTPLMWAAARGNNEIVKALLDYRRENKIFIDLLEANSLGENAIDLAFEHDKLTSLKRLQKATYIQAKTVISDALLKLIIQATENSTGRIETHQPYNPNLFVIIIAQYLSGASGNICDYCNAAEAENSCPCYQVRYCSKDCQKKHWKNHKVQCPEKIKKDDEIEEENVDEENNDNNDLGVD